MLTGSRTAALAATNDSTLAVDHFLEQFDVFVVDVHWPWAVPIDEDRVFFLGAGANARPFSGAVPRTHWAWRHGFSC